jgi:hypothetical protein
MNSPNSIPGSLLWALSLTLFGAFAQGHDWMQPRPEQVEWSNSSSRSFNAVGSSSGEQRPLASGHHHLQGESCCLLALDLGLSEWGKKFFFGQYSLCVCSITMTACPWTTMSIDSDFRSDNAEVG